MSFQLVPYSVTLDDRERQRNFTDVGSCYVKVVEDTPILSAAEM